MVTLKDARTFFCSEDCTARPDLLEDDANGHPRADFFLNMAQKHLDSLIDNPTSRCRLHVPIPANAYYVVAEDCRTVESVWWIDSTNKRYKLGRMLFEVFRLTFPAAVPVGTGLLPPVSQVAEAITVDMNFGNIGVPDSWALMTLLAPPRRNKAIPISTPLQSSTGLEGLQLGNGAFGLTGVIFAPAPTAAGTIEINGIFNSPALIDDNDISIWTLKHPDILCFAAAWFLENMYRNVEGARGWELAYQTLLRDIDRDMAAQEAAGITGIDVRYRNYVDYTTFQSLQQPRVQQSI